MGKISINCPSCDSSHPDIELNEYRGQQPNNASHWFVCPNTNDPVGVMIHSVQGHARVLNPDIMDGLSFAQDRGAFMVSIWWPESSQPDGSPDVSMRRVTHEFPDSHMDACLQLLRNDILNSLGTPQAGPIREAVPAIESDEPFARLFGVRDNGG